VPGGYLTWGILALGIGLFSVASSHHWAHRRNVMIGLLAQTVLFMFFTISLLASVIQSPEAPLTGIAIYGGYTILCAIAYAVGHELRRAERRREREGLLR
jgi:hypothetical protein